MTGWHALNIATSATWTIALKCHSSLRFLRASTSSRLKPVQIKSNALCCCSCSKIVSPTPLKIRPKKKANTPARQKRTIIVVRSRTAARSSRRMSCESCLRKLFCFDASPWLHRARPWGVLHNSIDPLPSSLGPSDVDGGMAAEVNVTPREDDADRTRSPNNPSACWRRSAHICATSASRSAVSVCTMKITKSAGLKPTGDWYPTWEKCWTIRSREPSYKQRPRQRQITRSTRVKISLLGWCNVQITVQPAEARSFNTRTTWYAAKESKPLVGSSKHTMSGRVMSSTPMAVRFRCPPDRPLMTPLPM
mmetsp:Transcript_68180/g.209044  ORF Transcript_68180/g.209044 Transcript_68180/m.209044 type:complete len:307 (-) Transcript_68180:741-1661(-)